LVSKIKSSLKTNNEKTEEINLLFLSKISSKMNESNKIETLESTRDKMALKCLETSKEEKIILMEKAKAKIQREIKILVNISTFKKDNS